MAKIDRHICFVLAKILLSICAVAILSECSPSSELTGSKLAVLIQNEFDLPIQSSDIIFTERRTIRKGYYRLKALAKEEFLVSLMNHPKLKYRDGVIAYRHLIFPREWIQIEGKSLDSRTVAWYYLEGTERSSLSIYYDNQDSVMFIDVGIDGLIASPLP
jgi:hypothetical protein